MDASLTYNSILAVFRLVGSDYYVAVDGSDIVIEVTTTEAFGCVTLPFTATVQTEPGDVVGACVGPRQGGNRRQLNLAGNNAIGYSVRGASRSGCPTNNLNSVTVMNSELLIFPDRILHLSAEFSELLDS